MKKLATLSSVGLSLFLAGCPGGGAKTSVTKSVQIPQTVDETNSDDQNADGQIEAVDNSFAALVDPQGLVVSQLGLDLNALLATSIAAGTVSFGFDISAKDFADDQKNVSVAAFLADLGGATPKFDGSDVIAVDGETFNFEGEQIINSKLSTGASNFVLALPFDPANPTNLPLNNAKITGAIADDGTLTNAKLTGNIKASDFAAGLGAISTLLQNTAATDAATFGGGTAVTCGAVADCDAVAAGGFCTDTNGDASSTGVCVATGSTTEGVFNNGLAVLDDNGNGSIEVSFNAGTQSFDTNEISELFTFDTTAGAGGILGALLFGLDIDANVGGRDAAGIGVLISTAAATK